MNTVNPKLALIIPCFNEQEVIESTVARLIEVIEEMVSSNEISDKSFIYLVNDGSIDKTWEIIEKLNNNNPEKVKGISFTRNFGNQKALLAGLLEVRKYNPDCAITIDADLQQDETKLVEFVKKYKQGAHIVFGIRNDRKTDGFLKRHTALAFYNLMNLFGAKIKPNHSEFRLTSSEILDVLSEYKEVNLFLRGIFSEFGYKSDIVYFDVKARQAGESKFSPVSLFSLALKGITSFSVVPLRLVSMTGILISLLSFILGFNVLWEKYTHNYIVPGWATIVVTVSFIGGIQILSIGVIGEYLGQLFQEVKARPRYLIEKELD